MPVLRRRRLFRAAVWALAGACASLFAMLPGRAGADQVQGIDVSSFQTAIDWNAVAGSGITFAFIKASEGCCATDSDFQTNWNHAKAAGITPGAYLFFHPGDDAAAQATLFIQQLESVGFRQGDLLPAIDVEVTDGQSPSVVISALHTVINTIEAALGALPAIYTAPSWWDAHVATSEFTADPLWVADWCGCGTPSLPADGWGGHGFTAWQYTDSTAVAGIAGSVDGDTASVAPLTYGGPPVLSHPDRVLAEGVAGNLQAVSLGPGRTELGWRDANGRLAVAIDSGGQVARLWTSGLPANMASDPAMVALPGGAVDVFWASSAGELWMATSSRGYAAQDLGAGGLATAPRAAADPSGVVAVSWAGRDGTIWVTELAGAVRTQPVSIGDGFVANAPAPAFLDARTIAVFWRGEDGNLWWDADPGGIWQGAQSIGGAPLASDPQPYAPLAGSLDVLWVGGDGIAWHAAYAGGWSLPGAVSGTGISGPPAAAVARPGQMAAVARDTSDQLWLSTYASGTGWSAPALVAAGAAGDGLAVAPAATAGRFDVFWVGAGGSLQHTGV